MSSDKKIIYSTSIKAFKRDRYLGYALIPFFGIGFLLIRKINKEIAQSEVHVYNDRIVKGHVSIPISEIEHVGRVSNERQKRIGLADLTVSSSGETIVFKDIEQAEKLEEALALAIKTEKQKRELAEKAKGYYEDEFKLGGLEHMNSLVGLWQQGLISDEDFREEQKKFRK